MMRKTPWLTEGSIAFLEKYISDHPKPKVLEFGSGASTLWFSKFASQIVSIEHNKQWAESVKKEANNPNLEVILHEAEHIKDPNGKDNIWRDCTDFITSDYSIEALKFPDDYFDIAVIDGRNRVLCFKVALQKTKGILVLDNSERKAYDEIHSLCSDFKAFHFEQTKPDSEGFWYEGWKTSIWIK